MYILYTYKYYKYEILNTISTLIKKCGLLCIIKHTHTHTHTYISFVFPLDDHDDFPGEIFACRDRFIRRSTDSSGVASAHANVGRVSCPRSRDNPHPVVFRPRLLEFVTFHTHSGPCSFSRRYRPQRVGAVHISGPNAATLARFKSDDYHVLNATPTRVVVSLLSYKRSSLSP